MTALPDTTFDPSTSQRLPQLSTSGSGHLAPGAPTDGSLRSPLTPPPTPILSDGSSSSSHSNNSTSSSDCHPNSKLTVSARQLSHHVLQPEFLAEYTLGDELGSGGFGFVVSATRNVDQREVAVKFIFREKVPLHGWAKDPELGLIPMEIYVLRNVQHPNIIGFLNAYQDYKFFYLVMELHGTPWSASNPLLNKSLLKPGPEKNNTNMSMVEAMAKATLNQQQNAAAAAAAAAGMTNSISANTNTTSSSSSRSFKLSPSSTSSSSSSLLSDAGSDYYDESPTSSSSKGTAMAPSSSSSSLPPAPLAIMGGPPKASLLMRRTSCDLFECIEHHSKFSESQARVIFKQIVECVDYLNARGICHRDIKDENIVIDNDFVVKLIDFGSAVIIPRPQGKLFDRFYGTINYASPEILKGEKYRAESAEIWSLGILLYTILYGEVPFNDPVQAISGPYIAPRVRSSSECLHLLNWMLAKTPERRATIDDVVNHPWITAMTMST